MWWVCCRHVWAPLGLVKCLLSDALGGSSATSSIWSNLCPGAGLLLRSGGWSRRMHPVMVLGLLAGCAWPWAVGWIVCGCLVHMDEWAVLWTGSLGLLALAGKFCTMGWGLRSSLRCGTAQIFGWLGGGSGAGLMLQWQQYGFVSIVEGAGWGWSCPGVRLGGTVWLHGLVVSGLLHLYMRLGQCCMGSFPCCCGWLCGGGWDMMGSVWSGSCVWTSRCGGLSHRLCGGGALLERCPP